MTFDILHRHDGSGRPHAPRRDARVRRGFALPMVILVIAFLTVTIAAAYAATSSELLTNSAQRGEGRAYMMAQAGLENFTARRNEPNFCASCGAPPDVLRESTTVTLPGGYAQVVAQRVRTATASRAAIYLLRSRGVDTSSKGLSGSSRGVYGERTVAQLVYWNVNQVNVLAGWTSGSGLDKTGSSGTISGVDNCTNPQKPTVAGIAVPTGDYSGKNFTPTGNPPIQFLGDKAATAAAMKIDWDGIVNGTRVQADYTFASGAAATSGWPSFSNPDFYPVIRVNGDFTLPDVGGRGTLIVMGNLTISGNNLWKGILLVGGTMTSNGNNTMLGATMSGLNIALSDEELALAQTKSSSVLTNNPANALAHGTKTFQYDSCEVAKAASGLASYSVYPNAWMDNFVTY